MKISNLTIFLILISQITFAQKSYEKDVRKWAVVNSPPRSDWRQYYDFLHLANYSSHEWAVEQIDGKVFAYLQGDKKPIDKKRPDFDTTVKLQDSKGPASSFTKVDDGWIAAYNMGEFGSAVYWFSEDGKTKRKLSDHQINEFFFHENRIFAVEGLAHLSLSRGSVIEILKQDDKWMAETFIQLPGSAEAVATTASGEYVIVTSDMLLRANLKRELNIIIPSGDWGSLYPNSVAIDDDGYIYIGMRQFVVRCKLSECVQSYELLVPDRSWLNKEK